MDMPQVDDQAILQQMPPNPADRHAVGMERPWAFTWAERQIRLTKATAAFERESRRVTGKAQLSQNRPLADPQGAMAILRHSQHELDRQVAALMADHQATIARQPI